MEEAGPALDRPEPPTQPLCEAIRQRLEQGKEERAQAHAELLRKEGRAPQEK